jgi:hypothetical protein
MSCVILEMTVREWFSWQEFNLGVNDYETGTAGDSYSRAGVYGGLQVATETGCANATDSTNTRTQSAEHGRKVGRGHELDRTQRRSDIDAYSRRLGKPDRNGGVGLLRIQLSRIRDDIFGRPIRDTNNRRQDYRSIGQRFEFVGNRESRARRVSLWTETNRHVRIAGTMKSEGLLQFSRKAAKAVTLEELK